MYPYMIGKGDEGVYKRAFNHSLAIYSSKDPRQMADYSASAFNPLASNFELTSLGQTVNISYPEGKMCFSVNGKSPVWPWRLIMLNYLTRSDNADVPGKLLSYRELENGHVFYQAFYRESISPLVKKVTAMPLDVIKGACLKLGAVLQDKADICAVFPFLPRFPVTVKLWLKDGEDEGSGNILFDSSANHYLHTEDIAVAGNLISYFLIKQCEIDNKL